MSIYFYFLYRHTQCHILLSSLMSTSPTKCSKPSCKNLVSDDNLNIHGLKYKKCKSCREKDSANTADRRKRKREEQPSSTEQGPSTRPRPSPSNLDELLRNFADGLEYQMRFGDTRMLDRLEREGATFFRFVESCLSRERRMNSTRGSSPTTWEKATSSAMFYRTRPPVADKDT